MAARVGVTTGAVVAEAVAMLDAGARSSDVTLGALARRLGIRPQSLYAHVDGIDGLADALAVAGLDALAAHVTPAAIGRDGIDGVEAIVRAHVSFALTRPGLYFAAIRPPGDSSELLAALTAVGRPMEIVLASLGMAEPDRVHWTRLFLSSICGFAMLRRDGQLSLPVDIDETVERLIAMLVGELPADASPGRRHDR